MADGERAVCRVAHRRRLPQQVPKGPPVALDCFKAAEPFTQCRRQTVDERRPLTPVIDKVPSQPNGKACRKTDKSACPEHIKLRSERALTCCAAVAVLRHRSVTRNCDYVSRHQLYREDPRNRCRLVMPGSELKKLESDQRTWRYMRIRWFWRCRTEEVPNPPAPKATSPIWRTGKPF